MKRKNWRTLYDKIGCKPNGGLRTLIEIGDNGILDIHMDFVLFDYNTKECWKGDII